MKILNSKEIDAFCWEHRMNGCEAVKSEEVDEEGLHFNIEWRDMVTGESIPVVYESFVGAGGKGDE